MSGSSPNTPFAATKKERIVAGDPSLSLEERYPMKEAYVSALSKVADSLVDADAAS